MSCPCAVPAPCSGKRVRDVESESDVESMWTDDDARVAPKRERRTAYEYNEKLKEYRALLVLIQEKAVNRLMLANDVEMVRSRHRKGKLPRLAVMRKAVRKLRSAIKKVCYLTKEE